MTYKKGYVYISTNSTNRVLYTGVTSNLVKRIWEHKTHVASGFTEKYRVDKLVYFEVFDSIEDAIAREKQIKSGPRRKKLDLIRAANFDFKDLYYTITS